MTELQAMKRALTLAMRGTGNVSPNPRVGCVILKNGENIAEGWHRRHGEQHAEIHALHNAGADAEGATLVVNLEPCVHYGNTPPCTNAIIESKISKVVIGMTDPNPKVSGKGIAALRAAGIDVENDVLEAEARWVNRFYTRFISTGKPYVVVKAAQSLDGCIATAYGQSKWISGEESRKRGHRLRREIDAVLVGATTVAKDDPELTVRMVRGRSPKRIVLDTELSLPLKAKLFTGPQRHDTYVCCSGEAAASMKANSLSVSGVNIIPISTHEGGKLDVTEVLEKVAELNISSILVEGGSGIFSSFARRDLIDEIHLFVAPIIVGNGLSAFAQLETPALKLAKKFTLKAISKSKQDYHVIAVREQPAQAPETAK